MRAPQDEPVTSHAGSGRLGPGRPRGRRCHGGHGASTLRRRSHNLHSNQGQVLAGASLHSWNPASRPSTDLPGSSSVAPPSRGPPGPGGATHPESKIYLLLSRKHGAAPQQTPFQNVRPGAGHGEGSSSWPRLTLGKDHSSKGPDDVASAWSIPAGTP